MKYTIGVLLIILAVGFGYGFRAITEKQVDPLGTDNFPNIPVSNEGSPEKEPVSVPAPEEYVKLISGGGPNAPHQATFQFLVPIQWSDIKPSNIFLCVQSASVGGIPNNQPCNSPGRELSNQSTVSGGDFSVSYDAIKSTVTITENSTDPNMGAFYVGCASCVSNIMFTNIHTETGILLPNKEITVY